MKKTVAVIPALLGSSRIPDKNLILVNGYPLMYYVVKACKASGAFSDIYINSEHEVFEKIAAQLDVKFYKRPKNKGGSECTEKNKASACDGGRCEVHDHFLVDFMENVKSDYLVQVHTTSPLIKPETLLQFKNELVGKKYDSLFTVEEKYTEIMFGDKPVNFDTCRKIPTQTLDPVRIISWAVSGWKTETFLETYYRDDINEDGPTFCGNMGIFPLNKIEALDADDFDDLFIIEACLSHRRKGKDLGKFRYNGHIREIDSNLQELIIRDGVDKVEPVDDTGSRMFHKKVADVKKAMGEKPWCYPLIYNDIDQICLIRQHPGEGCRRHFHATKGEWWMVLEGSFDWHLDDGTTTPVSAGEVIYLPKGTVHKIVCTGDTPGLRLTGGMRDMEHVYVE